VVCRLPRKPLYQGFIVIDIHTCDNNIGILSLRDRELNVVGARIQPVIRVQVSNVGPPGQRQRPIDPPRLAPSLPLNNLYIWIAAKPGVGAIGTCVVDDDDLDLEAGTPAGVDSL